jgi:hypothetical protein
MPLLPAPAEMAADDLQYRECFVLDCKHNVQCATRHLVSDYRRYTCCR